MSSTFETTFNMLKKQHFHQNIKQVIADSSLSPVPKYLSDKIHNDSLLKGYPEEKILEKIKTDEMYASFFAKDPLKQNLAEIAQLNILKRKFPAIKKLPGNGTKAVYILDGNIATNLKKKPLDSAKSLDFFDNTTNTYYISKYTKDSGGAQDNQYEDVIRGIKEANKNVSQPQANFVCLLDGDYYTVKKIENLRKLITNERIVINSSDTL